MEGWSFLAVLPDSIPEQLQRATRGRRAFAELLTCWLRRSNWSYAVFADLAEQAVIALEAADISSHVCKQGELRIFNGHVWRAKVEQLSGALPRYREASNNSEWEHICAVRRVAASQVNNYARQEVVQAHAEFFVTCGLLNQYIAEIKVGKLFGPVDLDLRKRATEGIVIADGEGPFTATEFFSVFVGLMKLPEIMQLVTDQEAAELSSLIAREIRNVMAKLCDLDLIEDWPQFISAYPSSDPARHAKIRDVVLGQNCWSAEQVRDEQAAVAIALRRLRTRHNVQDSYPSQIS
jgi:hypothetical protein